MSFFKVSKKEEDLKQSTGSHITQSGFYDVTVLAPVVNVSNGGSTSIDMYVEYSGKKQMVYGNLRIFNNDGSENEIGTKIFNQLLVIAGVDEVSDPEEVELPIGKKEAVKTVAILEDLTDIDVTMRVQMEYGSWNGDITEKKVIKSFYRQEDKASAEEIVNDKNYGDNYEKEKKYENNITYKDNVTPEMVVKWIADGRPKGTAGNSETSHKTPSFSKRRFNSKK